MTTLDEQLKAMGEACIDNTPQQVENLAKELESRSSDIHVSLVISASDSSEARAKKFFDAVNDAIKGKAARERDEQAKLLLIDLCGDDVFKDRDWEYHKKFTHSAELAFRLVDKKWRKGE